jgi:hypothetical protein
MQDNATANTADRSRREVFGDQVIDQWPPRSPDLKPCDFNLWGMLKDKVYVNNPHTAEELQENFRRVISNISQEEICRVFRSVLTRCEACLQAQGITLNIFCDLR